MSDTCEALVRRHWHEANRSAWDSFAALLSPGLVYEVPQTRERIRGSAGYVDLFRTWPGPWRAEVVNVIAQAGKAVTVIDFVTATERMTGITFFEIEAGKIARVTDFWPEPYEPPARFSKYIERYAPLPTDAS
ncbi:nuclear transport factor 2 family protein [Ramlibacter sp. WS9]|uniref:nuclear transport factor 2 family protein n=1 Tax=Ramlibacter sp. WS9 TaxID=1882741 RepID=UPI0013053500|nr:nuclear transport factor 2 family protein [Ramlibacter sp. WS9]